MTDLSFPPMLEDLAKTRDVQEMDFEMYEAFEHPEETAEWYRMWTGNKEVDGGGFRFFGMEGAGGYVGLWLVRRGRPLTEQSVVFLGSEGELAVMATDVEAFLWLVAQGHGPHEGMGWSVPSDEPDPRAWEIARRHAPDAPRVPAEILRRAQEEFPNFQEYIDAQCN